MKNYTLLFLWLFTTVCIHGQNYYIDFTASGTTSTLDSVFVENLTQGTSLTLQGSDTLHLLGTTDVSNIAMEESFFKIYPNPFNETSHVEFYSETPTIASIDVYDIVGKHILQLRQDIQKGYNVFEISGFATGHYHLIVKTENRQISGSFFSLNTNNQNPKIRFINTLSEDFDSKTIAKSAKNIIQMLYTTGNQMRFIGYSGLMSEIVNDVPTSNKTIDFVFASFTCGATFTDPRDGNDYPTVQIDNQCWMAKNLAYLPSVVGPATGSQTTPYYYVYGYNGTSVTDAKATANYTTYGVLYNWPAAMNGSASSAANPSGVQGVCPTGWHLPSDAEWTELTDFVGGANNAGTKLKATSGWNSGGNGTDDFGFTALPGGSRNYNGNFYVIGYSGIWWSATENDVTSAWIRSMHFNSSNVGRNNNSKEVGFSVRCVRVF